MGKSRSVLPRGSEECLARAQAKYEILNTNPRLNQGLNNMKQQNINDQKSLGVWNFEIRICLGLRN